MPLNVGLRHIALLQSASVFRTRHADHEDNQRAVAAQRLTGRRAAQIQFFHLNQISGNSAVTTIRIRAYG
jgi:hypothetical protein